MRTSAHCTPSSSPCVVAHRWALVPATRRATPALAHLWLGTTHPFDYGNGRVGRAIVDLVLARDSGEPSRLLLIWQLPLAQRKDYCWQLQRAPHGARYFTRWVTRYDLQIKGLWPPQALPQAKQSKLDGLRVGGRTKGDWPSRLLTPTLAPSQSCS